MEAAGPMAMLGFVVVVLYWFAQSKGGRTPPGPQGLPFVGYLPFMTQNSHLKLWELQKTYGPVYSLRLGSEYVIVLGDFAFIKTAFSQDAFMGRPKIAPFDLSKESLDSEAFTGMPWEEWRKLSLHLFRDVRFGKVRTEEHITEEIKDLLLRFESIAGQPTTVTDLLTSSMSSNIASLVLGKRMNPEDPKRIQLDKMLNEFGSLVRQVSWQIYFPWIKSMMQFFHVGIEEELKNCTKRIKDFIWQEIEEHESTMDPNNTRDFIDGYLAEIERRKGNSFFSKEVLRDLMASLLVVGSESVRIAVEWLLLTVTENADVQGRVQQEIDAVIGKERSPTGTDQHRMPYATAAILESLRWRTVNPVRYTLSDVELNGYFIPKDSTVVANLWAVHNDPVVWGKNASVYDPDRFLTEDGNSIKKIDHFIPFSIGKRSCPGETFARAEIFLYFVSILQRFNLSYPSGHSPDLDGSLVLALTPKIQKLCIVKRY